MLESKKGNLMNPAVVGKPLVLACVLMLLGGCTTYVGKINRDENYSKPLTQTAVLWVPSPAVYTRIKRTAQGYNPGISEKDKAASQENIREMLVLFATEVPATFGERLAAKKVEVLEAGSVTETTLKLTPSFAETECVPIGCSNSIWVQAALVDNSEKKTVWSGSFKVGAPLANKSDASTVANFADSVVSELRKAKLIRN